MSTQAECSNLSKYEHSPFILDRRRNLFPSDDEDRDSDLGQPLCSDSGSDIEESGAPVRLNFGEYDILCPLDNTNVAVTTPTPNKNTDNCSETFSPLCLSPYTSHIKNSTFSPSHTLKTPNETSNKLQNLPKRVRKSFVDETTSLKRKIYETSESPNHNKILKLDSCSKVRTALFPPEVDLSLPTQSFYPKMEEKPITKYFISKESSTKPVTFSINRNLGRYRKNAGKINNGVRHKIKKPKQKKNIISKVAVDSFLKSGPALTEYIQDLNELKKLNNNSSTKQIKGINDNKDRNAVEIITNNFKSLDENKENISFLSNPMFQSNQIRKETNAHTKSVVSPVQDNKKRPASPLNEPNQSKKFFKFNRSKNVVTVNKSIKLSVNHGKIVKLENKKHIKKPCFNLDTTDLTKYCEDTSSSRANIDNILSTLEDNITTLSNNANMISSDTILSPISQMCDVTSGLALNSPKKGRNLTNILNNMHSASTNKEQKLFPVFCNGANSGVEKNEDKIVRNTRRMKKLGNTQMLLDAGQSNFGYEHCQQCNIFYHRGDPTDEMMHLNYHNSEGILKFMGWKNEHVIADFNKDGRIIRIMPTDSKAWIKKAKEVMELVNRELGCYEMEFDIGKSQVYLYIKNKTIIGCAVATVPKSYGHKMLTSNNETIDMCSEEAYPIKCGLSRIWVAPNIRKQGIATNLMNAIKNNFVFGSILENDDIAITAPTEAGAAFARKYFNTANYLVYYT